MLFCECVQQVVETGVEGNAPLPTKNILCKTTSDYNQSKAKIDIIACFDGMDQSIAKNR